MCFPACIVSQGTLRHREQERYPYEVPSMHESLFRIGSAEQFVKVAGRVDNTTLQTLQKIIVPNQ